MTTQEELDLVDAAISQVLAGRVQEFGEGQHRARVLDLKTLYSRRDELRTQLAQEGGSIFRPVVEVASEDL